MVIDCFLCCFSPLSESFETIITFALDRFDSGVDVRGGGRSVDERGDGRSVDVRGDGKLCG